jgi:regulatory protein
MRRHKPEAPLTAEAARLKALRLLGRREHSARELRGKLQAGGVDDDTAETLVEVLAEEGWQSDPRFAESRIHNRIVQGYGPLRIEAELRVAGLPDTAIHEAMDAADCDWAALCCEVYRRKYRGPAQDRAERLRRHRQLAARGFSSEHIRAALSAADDEDTPDDFEATP